jgi:hypothetical protein
MFKHSLKQIRQPSATGTIGPSYMLLVVGNDLTNMIITSYVHCFVAKVYITLYCLIGIFSLINVYKENHQQYNTHT